MSAAPHVLEIFSCSGGMAEGLRRAGIHVTMAVDYDPNACASYAENLGHAPVRMDVRELLRLVEAGWLPLPRVELLVADPPCTPWSRAGKRKGTDDERDMLVDTVRLVELLRPRFWLIANVPGLDDGPNWPTVQRTIGGLSRLRYCIDSARLDAADYGTPQHRVRPFWFGHGIAHPCITWPMRTHGPVSRTAPLPGVAELHPWVTCRQALGHLSPEDLGTPIRLRWRGANGAQVASVPDRPARVVGTSNLSDGNVLAPPTEAFRKDRRGQRHPGRKARATHLDEPAGVITSRENQGDGCVLFDGPNHRPSREDHPARTLTRNTHGDGALLVSTKHPAASADAPSGTIRGGGAGHSAPPIYIETPHHPPSELDEPSRTVRASSAGTPDKVLLTNDRHPVNRPDEPSFTVTTKGDGRGAQGACVVEWPWERPSTVVTTRGAIPPPGHHPESGSILSLPNAVKLSEKAAAILQGFPESWVFVGKTKKARWAQIGMAMPPPLAEAVGRSIRRVLDGATSKVGAL